MATSKVDGIFEVLKLGAISWLLYVALRSANFEAGLWKPAVHLLGAGFLIVVYSVSRKLARTYEEVWKSYLLVFYLAGALSLLSWANYGTHVEDADPLFGGGETVVDFVPAEQQRSEHALNLLVLLLVPGFYGVYRERKI
jgi:multidrug transporter EmrE-like cation transporter